MSTNILSQMISPDIEVTTTEQGWLIENNLPLSPHPSNIGTLLRKNAEKSPNKLFISERVANSWQGVTYKEALTIVNSISNSLWEKNGSAPIAILSPNSVRMALLQLAAMQVGIPIVPISYAYLLHSQTGTHIEHILQTTGAKTLIIGTSDLDQRFFPAIKNLQIYSFADDVPAGIEPWSSLIAAETNLNEKNQQRFVDITPNTLAKIQFTSGSTGLPKGVMVTHGMMVSNQRGILQMWPFITSEEIVVDWLPWNHTFGGNFVFNMILLCGGTFYIDHGNPTPSGVKTTIHNIMEISPTIYFGVPRSYTVLYSHLQQNEALRKKFFQNLKFIFTAAAALDQATYKGMKTMAVQVKGEKIPFLAGWGSTETSPCSTLVFWDSDDTRVIGLPLPGVKVKLAADMSGKRELRVKGPNITRGYYNNQQASRNVFDEESYYRTGDAGEWLCSDKHTQGLIFAGRIGEDFKLTTGTWVRNSELRSSIHEIAQPFLAEIVVAAPNRPYLTALIFPNIPYLRQHFSTLTTQYPKDEDFLRCQEIRLLFCDFLCKHNTTHQTSSKRFVRFILLADPPHLDRNETTDKSYINQNAVLENRFELVERLYAEPPGMDVIKVSI